MKPIEDLAREAAEGLRVEYHCDRVWLERFAALVRAEALEDVKVAIKAERLQDPTDSDGDIAYGLAVNDCYVAAIRALAVPKE